jgi:hypothetical protein
MAHLQICADNERRIADQSTGAISPQEIMDWQKLMSPRQPTAGDERVAPRERSRRIQYPRSNACAQLSGVRMTSGRDQLLRGPDARRAEDADSLCSTIYRQTLSKSDLTLCFA